jgi:hypothetical protein
MKPVPNNYDIMVLFWVFILYNLGHLIKRIDDREY